MQNNRASGAAKAPARTTGAAAARTKRAESAGVQARPNTGAKSGARPAKAASAPRGRSAQMQRSAKRRRRRRNTGLIRALVVLVLVLGIAGIAMMISTDEVKRETLQVYPMEYTDLIRRHAAQHNLEPAYVAAVILAESSYNPQAVSSVNAQGLMQIMPETGDWIAGKFNESYVEGCLFDPETNIRYGCWYLGFLMDRYDGDKRCSSAAYHSGQGTVDKWLKDPAYSTDGKTLNVIAGTNADTYVNRVLEYYEKYDELYQKQVPA